MNEIEECSICKKIRNGGTNYERSYGYWIWFSSN